MKLRTLAALGVLGTLVTATAWPCTVFLIARDGQVLAGNNEDWTDPDTKIWFVAEEEKAKYGRVYFGFGNWFGQGGMNEKGLFFDGLALGGEEDEKPEKKPVFPGNLIDEAMKTCATVDEVIELFERWDFGQSRAQLMFGDAKGDSVIIERTAFHEKRGDFQVSTNFRLTRQTPEESGCRRYAAATDKLSKCKEPTVDAARRALIAAQQSLTVYSNVYDLVAGDVYVWLNHDFDSVVQFNLQEELEHGSRKFDLPKFFADRSDG